MSARDGWRTVTRRDPCPLCKRGDWCRISDDGRAVLCGRVEAPPPGWGGAKSSKDGRMVYMREDGRGPRDGGVSKQRQRNAEPARDWTAETQRFRAALDDARRDALARELGVAPSALEALALGWDGQAFTVPEHDGHGDVVGIARRFPDGGKAFVKGGRRGIIVPRDVLDMPDPILVVEGMSDVAACLTMGLAAVGRPSSVGGAAYLAELLGGREVLVVGERDQKEDGAWPGRDGAVKVARELGAAWGKPVRWALPPADAKDAREHLRALVAAGLNLEDEGARRRAGAELLDALGGAAETVEPAAQPWGRIASLDEPPLPRFPVEALGPRLAAFVKAVCRAYQVSEDATALLALAAFATTVAKRYALGIRPGWRESLNLYLAVALPPGERKSRTLSELAAPLVEWESEKAAEVAPEIRRATRARADVEARIKSLRAKAASGKKESDRATAQAELERAYEELDSIQVPVRPQLCIDDATPEALGRVIAKNGGRIAALVSEGGLFETLAGRYSDGVSNIDLVLKGWDGAEPWRRDRVDEREEVRSPIITFGFFVQPDVVRGLAEKRGFRGRGLIGRFLYALPTSLLGARDVDPEPVPDELRRWWRATLRRLLDAPDERDALGEIVTREVPFSNEARDVLLAFAGEIEPRLGPDGDLRPLSDWAGKLVGITGRLAGLLHVLDAPGNEARGVPAAPVRRAVEIARAFLVAHARAALELMGSDPTIERARELLRWIRRRRVERFQEREGLDAVRRSCRRMDEVREALAVLAERGYVRRLEESPARGPGRPASPAWEVNLATFDHPKPSAESAESTEGGSYADSAGSSERFANASAATGDLPEGCGEV